MSKDNAQVFFRGKGAVQLNHRASQPRYAFCHGGGITAGDQLMKRLLAFIHIATGENTLAEAMLLTLGNAPHSYFQGHLQPEDQPMWLRSSLLHPIRTQEKTKCGCAAMSCRSAACTSSWGCSRV